MIQKIHFFTKAKKKLAPSILGHCGSGNKKPSDPLPWLESCSCKTSLTGRVCISHAASSEVSCTWLNKGIALVWVFVNLGVSMCVEQRKKHIGCLGLGYILDLYMGFITALIVKNICLGHPHKNQTELHGEFVLHVFFFAWISWDYIFNNDQEPWSTFLSVL